MPNTLNRQDDTITKVKNNVEFVPYVLQSAETHNKIGQSSRMTSRTSFKAVCGHVSMRIEGLLAAFSKLIGITKQDTYVETENVRYAYVYQSIEALYLLLVTNKQSNIVEDLETLRLLSKLVLEYSPSIDEEGICRTSFELIFAFDEVISLGHKENVTVA